MRHSENNYQNNSQAVSLGTPSHEKGISNQTFQLISYELFSALEDQEMLQEYRNKLNAAFVEFCAFMKGGVS